LGPGGGGTVWTGGGVAPVWAVLGDSASSGKATPSATVARFLFIEIGRFV
jgi:hypothetical protein